MNLTASSEARFVDDVLPAGAVVDGNGLDRDVREAFDFIVVGSGAAGAVAAHVLSKAGWSVAIVEEGPWVKTRDFGEDVYGSFSRMMRGAGTQVLKGRTFMPLLQGRCVGGSTVVNSAIAWRTPEDVIDDWAKRFGLGEAITMADLEPQFAVLERELSARPVDEAVLGRNNALFIEQMHREGATAGKMVRYDRGCVGSARCIQGCPNGAKQSMSVSYVPWSLALGARIFTSCRVDRVMVQSARAVGVRARAGERGLRVDLFARRGVFVAASTVQTPNILHRSGLRGAALGAHFQAHPGTALAGVFDSPIDMHKGATQGAESIHFRKTDRIKFETISMPPELAAARIPGVGAELLGRLASLGHAAVWALQVRMEAEGTVRPGWGGTDRVRLTPTPADMVRTRKGCAILATLLFDAGAREIWPGIYGLPPVMRSPDDVRLIAEGPLDPRAYSFIATHLFGAARMGPDPRTSVVGLGFETHAAEGLYVIDSSVFPTNLGVNPQHTIMALARLAATRIAGAPRVAVAA